jgi:4-diphosphocytidyl-2-C-methyl-D-erythritol kinase
MIQYPNCKINLGLHIVGRRPDGYHNLETIFLPVHDLCDELEIVEVENGKSKEESVMVQDGIVLDNAPEDNLCMRAWRLLHEEFDIPAVSIRLKKNIPFGAGLGGGSSDAAFTLKMLNEMFSLSLNIPDLEQRAARIGADCAFFICNQAAYATGIGDVLQPLPECSILNSQFSIQIEIPEGEHVSTREAYAGLKLSTHSSRTDLRQAIRQPIGEWRHLIVNDFEASVFPSHPAIEALKADMYNRGALYASMTGSGAAVFGLFRK